MTYRGALLGGVRNALCADGRGLYTGLVVLPDASHEGCEDE